MIIALWAVANILHARGSSTIACNALGYSTFPRCGNVPPRFEWTGASYGQIESCLSDDRWKGIRTSFQFVALFHCTKRWSIVTEKGADLHNIAVFTHASTRTRLILCEILGIFPLLPSVYPFRKLHFPFPKRRVYVRVLYLKFLLNVTMGFLNMQP